MRKYLSNKNVQVKAYFDDDRVITYPSIRTAALGLGISAHTLRNMRKAGRNHNRKAPCHIEFWEGSKPCGPNEAYEFTRSTSLPSWGVDLPVHKPGVTIYEVYNEDEYLEFESLEKAAFLFKIPKKLIESCLCTGTPFKGDWFIDECVY